MASRLTLTGSLTVEPTASGSTIPSIPIPISVSFDTARQQSRTVHLDTDPAETVDLGDISMDFVWWVSRDDKAVASVISSAEGATQALPRSRAQLIDCRDSAITALTFQRDAGVSTIVDITWVQKS